MKKIIFILIAVFSIGQVSAQKETLEKEIKVLEKQVNELSGSLNNIIKAVTTDEQGNNKSEEEILTGFMNLLMDGETKPDNNKKNINNNVKAPVRQVSKTTTSNYNFDKSDANESQEVLISESFVVSNEADVLEMFATITEARTNGLVAQNIWDNFGLGVNFNENIHVDGRIDTDTFIGDIPGNTGPDTNIGSGFGGKNDRPGSGYTNGGDPMDPTGTGLGTGSGTGAMEDGFGNSYRGGGNGNGWNNEDPGGGGGNKGSYTGQMGSDGGTAYADNTGKDYGGGSTGGTNGGLDNDAGTVWSVEATHSSRKYSGSGGFSSFIHHSESVSNDKGYSSTTDKQSFTSENGTTTTRVLVTKTQPDGSSKTSATTTTTDADGNKHTEQTYTEKNSDGEVTKQSTKESNDPPKEGDDQSCQPADDGYHEPSAPPSDAEKGSAVWRAVANGGLSGGRGDDRTGQNENDMSSDTNPQNIQNTRGYMEQRSTGGKINVNKINTGNIDPSGQYN